MSPHKHPKPKSNSRIFMTIVFITVFSFTLLLIPTCTQASPITVTDMGVNHE